MKRLARGSTMIRSSRWAAYASAGVASVFGGAGEVGAEIPYSGPVRHVLDVGSHSTTLAFFDLEGGARLLFDFGRFGAGRGSAFVEIEASKETGQQAHKRQEKRAGIKAPLGQRASKAARWLAIVPRVGHAFS